MQELESIKKARGGRDLAAPKTVPVRLMDLIECVLCLYRISFKYCVF